MNKLDNLKYLVEYINRIPQIFEVESIKACRINGNTTVIKLAGMYKNKGLKHNITFKTHEYNPETKWIILTTSDKREIKMKGFVEAGDLFVEFPDLMFT